MFQFRMTLHLELCLHLFLHVSTLHDFGIGTLLSLSSVRKYFFADLLCDYIGRGWGVAPPIRLSLAKDGTLYFYFFPSVCVCVLL